MDSNFENANLKYAILLATSFDNANLTNMDVLA
ncbi:hypothetical protein ES702_04750 [subsurface metagenome]